MDRTKVMLMGASGRLGSILRACWRDPTDLVCHSRSARPGFLCFDPLAEAGKMKAAMADCAAVICLSGVTPAWAAAHGDAMSDNGRLALSAIEAAQLAGVPRVFLASSAAVYGATAGPLQEDDPCHPVSDYGRAKLEMERAALDPARAGGPSVTVLRIGNVAGADAILGGWRAAMQIDQLPAGGTPRRSYIGPRTLTRVIQALCTAEALPDIVNVAAPGAIEMGALLDSAGLAWSPRPATPATIACVELATRRLETLYGFAAKDSTAAGMVAEWRAIHAQE